MLVWFLALGIGRNPRSYCKRETLANPPVSIRAVSEVDSTSLTDYEANELNLKPFAIKSHSQWVWGRQPTHIACPQRIQKDSHDSVSIR